MSIRIAGTILVLTGLIALSQESGPKNQEKVNFDRIKSEVLMPFCGACHIEEEESEFSMATYEALLAGGESGDPALVPGKPDESPLLTRIVDGEMPPDNLPAPPDVKIELLKHWIEMGAPK